MSLLTAQTPLKRTYRANPPAALAHLTSTGTLSSSTLTCHLPSSRTAGLHPLAGGPPVHPTRSLCSGNMLLDALVACSGVTFRAVAEALQVRLVRGTVTAEGRVDFRGTLGVDGEVPVGVTGIRVVFEVEVEGSLPEEVRRELGMLTERYCVVLQTLREGVEVEVRVGGE